MDNNDLQAIRNLLKEELEPLKIKLEEELAPIKTKLDETYQIVKALEHSAEVNKAEHDKMSNDIAHMEGHLNNIDENIGAVKDIIGRHEVDITVLKRSPV